MINKVINSNKEELIRYFQDELSQLFKENSDKSILLLLSGGSAFNLLTNLDENIFSSKVTIGVLDERADSDPKINNFSQLLELDIIKNVKEKGVKLINTKLKSTPEELAERFEQDLEDWFESNPNGIVIATIGMGPDGHTSGVMPFPEDEQKFKELFESDKLVVFYNAESKNQFPLRVTTSLTFMKDKIDYGFAFITGSEKEDKLTKTLQEGLNAEAPARVFNEMKNLTILTDIQI